LCSSLAAQLLQEARRTLRPEQDKQLGSDQKALLQVLLLRHLRTQQGAAAASPAVGLRSPVAVSPLLVSAAALPPPSSSSSPVPPSSYAPFPGPHARMPDMLHPAAASELGFGSSLPCKHEQGAVTARSPKRGHSRPKGAGTAPNSQEHTHQVMPHLAAP